MSQIQDLEPLLKSLEALKPPGASKSKIANITQICVDNITSDSTIAQKLFSHFKRTPATHKLGVLYVIDSITRRWIEQARQIGQELAGSNAPAGSYASGVHKMTELMPSFVDDMIRVSPQDQKDKLENLVNIWERGNTFPLPMIADFKQKLKGQAASAQLVPSRTPPGSPPQTLLTSLGIAGGARPGAASQSTPSQPDAASVLRALAGMGGQPQQTAHVPPPPPPPAAAAAAVASAPQDLSAILASLGKPPSQTPQQPAVSTPVPPVPQFASPLPPPQPAMPPQMASLFQGAAPPPPVPQFSQPPPQAQNPMAALAALIPPHILTNPEQLTKVLQLFQQLIQANIPQDQWGPVVAALYPPGGQQPAAPASNAAPTWQPPQQAYNGASAYGHNSTARDRSRSPDYRRDRGNNSGRRPSPVYGVYDASARDNNDSQDDNQGGRRQGSGRFRQRTPPGSRDDFGAPSQNLRPKWTDIDPTVEPGHIKVLSRTLFVGGANGSEADIRGIFSRFGPVQTCIVNNDKRHAFVKMCSRADAVAARDAMETIRDPDVLSKARQTKWGVGFGPRECCDYSTGVSTIPISALTDADNKWVLSAEFGGTGGRPIESGLVFEEPDIEIGAGVSSKAMSRRVGPDVGGKRGGRGGGGYNNDGGRQRYRQPEQRYESPRPEPVTIQPPPAVPSFGFNFAMPGSMPPY